MGDIRIEEIGGKIDLGVVQAQSCRPLAQELVRLIRRGLESGVLKLQDGRCIRSTSTFVGLDGQSEQPPN